jgi:hypothetical protein
VSRIRESEPVLLLDNGDIIKGYGRQPELKYETALKAMAEMGYVATNVGEKDLKLGADYVNYVSGFTGVPLISANILDHASAPVFQQYVMAQPEGASGTAAIIGVISTEFKDEIESLAPGLVVEGYDLILEGLVEELRPKADLLILLAHARDEETNAIAQQFPEIDLIIASHVSDDPIPTPLGEGDTPILFAGTKGMHAGVARLDMQEGRPQLVSYAAEKLDGEIEDSARILAIIKDYQQMIKAEGLLENYPRIPHETAKVVGADACRRCHSLSSSRFGKSKHSHGFDVLVEKGHDYDPECVACHTVGFGYDSGFMTPEETPALVHVGCENCHGPGEKHIDDPIEQEYGEVAKTTCEGCHTPENSPGFSYDEKIEEIQHNEFFLCSAKICHWLD